MSSLDDLIVRIKETPISSIVSAYGFHVTRKGAANVTVCPFHDDHDPSMHVNDSKGMFFCFVDDLGGDAIKFVQLYRKLDFIDALKDICEHMGWNFADYQQEKRQNPKFEMAKKVLTKAAQLYRKLATTGNFEAYNDFIKKRGLNAEIASTYTLGYSTGDNAFSRYLSSIPNQKERTFALKIAEEIGIIRPDKHREDAHYDTFRERVMFPIWDQAGQVIGFTSRTTRPEQKPKYMNSVDSFIFNKKNLLYGLHLAKNPLREKDQVILVEGNMDQVALFNNGFKNAVAIMGVALGDSSLERLLPLTKNIFLAFDNDQAGRKASERINRQFMEKGITPLYVDLSPEKDPDDFLVKLGRLEFQKRLDEARPFIDVLIDSKFPEKIPEVTDQKLNILKGFYEDLAALGSGLLAQERIALLAKRLGLTADPASIIKDYEGYLAGQKAPKKAAPRLVEAPMTESIDSKDGQHRASAPDKSLKIETQFSRAEKTLVMEVVQNPELLVREDLAELLDFVEHDEVKTFLSGLRDLYFEIDESEYQSMVSRMLEGDKWSLEFATFAGAAVYKYRSSELNEKVITKMLGDIKRRLQEDQLKTKKEALKLKQKDTQTQEEFDQLLKELSKIDKELSKLKSTGRRPVMKP